MKVSRLAVTASLAAGAVTCLMASPAAAATPRFGAAIVVTSRSKAPAGGPAVAVASGRVAVAWQGAGGRVLGVVVRRGTTSGRFGAPERLSRSGYGPSVAAGRAGGAAAVWQVALSHDRFRVEVAVARGHGRFGKPHVLATAHTDSDSHQIVAAGGRYVVIWSQEIPGKAAHVVRYAVSDAAGRFGRVRTLAKNAQGGLAGHAAAVDPAGRVIATWELRRQAPSDPAFATATLAPRPATFTPPRVLRLARQGTPAGTFGISAGPGGVAAGWIDRENPSSARLQTARLSGTAQPAPETVATVAADFDTRRVDGLALSLPGAGLAPVASWAVLDSPQGDLGPVTAGRVSAASRRPDGSYGDPVQISSVDTIASRPVAAATRSAAVVTWSAGLLAEHLQYAVRSGFGAFGAPRDLMSRRVYPHESAVLASSRDAAVAAWVVADHPSASGLGSGVAVAILRSN